MIAILAIFTVVLFPLFLWVKPVRKATKYNEWNICIYLFFKCLEIPPRFVILNGQWHGTLGPLSNFLSTHVGLGGIDCSGLSNKICIIVVHNSLQRWWVVVWEMPRRLKAALLFVWSFQPFVINDSPQFQESRYSLYLTIQLPYVFLL